MKGLGGKVVPQVGHSSEITQLKVASDGRFLLTGSEDGSVKLWSPDGRLLRTLPVGYFGDLALAPDNSAFAVTRLNRQPELWSLLDERVLRFPAAGVGMFRAIGFAPDGSYLVTCHTLALPYGCVIYDRAGRIVRGFTFGGKSAADGIGFSPDSATIYLGIGKGLYRVDRSGEGFSRIAETPQYIHEIAVSSDGRWIAGHGRVPGIPTMHVWNHEGKRHGTFATKFLTQFEFSHANDAILSADDSPQIRFHDLKGQRPRRVELVEAEKGSFARVALGPNDAWMATAFDRQPAKLQVRSLDGKVIRDFGFPTSSIGDMDYSPAAGVIATVSWDDQLRLWSLDGRLIERWRLGPELGSRVAIAPDGKTFATAGKRIALWRTNGAPRTEIDPRFSSRQIAFDGRGERLFALGYEGEMVAVPLQENQRIQRLRFRERSADTFAVHPDGTTVAVAGSVDVALSRLDGTRVGEGKVPEPRTQGSIRALHFSPDGQELVAATDRFLLVYDAQGKLLRTKAYPSRNILLDASLALSNDGRWIAATVNQRDIGLFERSTLELRAVLKGHEQFVGSLEFVGQTHLVSADNAGIVRLWNLNNGESYSMQAADSDWIVYSDDGYFDASLFGGRLVSYVKGLDHYDIGQFALYLNRPDILYDRMGVGGTEALAHFRSHHERRLADANVSLEAGAPLSIPKSAFTRFEISGSSVNLTFEGSSSIELKSAQIFVNDVPTYPRGGKSISGKQVKLSDRIELAAGDNKVEVSVTNAQGVESLRATRYAQSTTKVKRDLYYVGLGVADYRDASLDLKYAAKDVVDFAEFVQRYSKSFNNVHRLVLTDTQVVRQGLPKVADFLKGTQANDVVVLLVAGHGGYDLTNSPSYYFLSHEADPEHLDETAIKYSELESLLDGLGARTKLMLLDTCDSGELAPTVLVELRKLAAEKGLSVRERKRRVRDALGKPRDYLFVRDRMIYSNLSRQTGTTIFSASLLGEASLEAGSIQNGVFTASVMQALANPRSDSNGDGAISITELETAVKLMVATATSHLQHPYIERENTFQPLRLPVLR